MRKKLYIYERKTITGSTTKNSAKKKCNWQVCYTDENGKKGLRRSINSLYMELHPEALVVPLFTYDEALILATEAMARGLVKATKKEDGCSILFLDYVKEVMDYDSSTYVRRKNRESKNGVSRKTLKDNYSAFLNHISGEISPKLLLSDFDPCFTMKLKDRLLDKGLSASQINKGLQAMRTAMNEAFLYGYVKEDYSKRIVNLPLTSNPRGIPTEEEMERILSWLDKTTEPTEFDRYQFLTVSLGVQTGMRMNEILTLRPSDFSLMPDGNYKICVDTSFNKIDGVKCTKNGETRFSTCSRKLGDEVLSYASNNPNNDGFVFFQLDDPTKKLDDDLVRGAFYKACESNGIDYEGRNIVFHSLRHFHSTLVRKSSDLRMEKISTGHKTDAMAEHYSSHVMESDLVELAKIKKDLFSYESKKCS